MLYLFDIDGTLVHCHGAGRRAFERACAPLLGDGSLQGISLDGKTDPLILREAFEKRLGRAPAREEAEAIAARYCEHLEEEVRAEGTVRKLAYVDEALAQLGARGVLGLATGNWRAGARIKLARIGLWENFPLGGFGCDADERGELVRVGRRRGEERLGRPLRKQEVLVIGDTPRDIAAARAAGALAIGVATGSYSVADLDAAGADAACADLRAACAEIARLAGA